VSRFRFRLDPVLDLRRYQVERAQAELLRRQEELAAAQRDLQALRERGRAAGAALEASVQAGVQAGALRSRSDALSRLGVEALAAERGLAERRLAAAQARAAVLRAYGRRRALEIVRESAREAHLREAARRAQSRLDELAARLARRGAWA
jgi:flagellar export protein FliJ